MIFRKAIEEIIPYVPGKLKEGAIKLASNENPLGTSPRASERLRAMAANVSLYPDGGCVRLKQKLADKYGLNPENFIVGNGSDEVLVLIAGALIDPGCNSVVSECTFSEYAFATRLFGGHVRTAGMKDGRFQLDAIREKIDGQTRIVFLCNPNNPTGTFFNHDALAQFLKTVPQSVLVVVDEAYSEYVRAADYPRTLSLLAECPNLVMLRTFSKIYGMAGLRVGYGMGQAGTIAHFDKAREPFNVNSLAQESAIAALDDAEFVRKSIDNNEEGKKYLYSEFDKMGLRYYPTEANFIFVYVNRDTMEVFEKLMDLGVTIRPMRSFGVSDAIRVTVGTPEQNRFFISALKKVV